MQTVKRKEEEKNKHAATNSRYMGSVNFERPKWKLERKPPGISIVQAWKHNHVSGNFCRVSTQLRSPCQVTHIDAKNKVRPSAKSWNYWRIPCTMVHGQLTETQGGNKGRKRSHRGTPAVRTVVLSRYPREARSIDDGLCGLESWHSSVSKFAHTVLLY